MLDLSDHTLQSEIDMLLFYRKMPSLSVLAPNPDHRGSFISMYRITRYVLGEPIYVWFKLAFGRKIRLDY